MTNPTVLPPPESTYQLLLDAARTWPGAVAAQRIPDPSAQAVGVAADQLADVVAGFALSVRATP